MVNPSLACLSWRLMHRSTPTDEWAKRKGWSLTSRCHNCFSEEESDLHLFFTCSLAKKIWCWLLSFCVVRVPSSFSAASIWDSIAKDGDGSGRKCAAAIFLHAIFVLWQLRNDSKHSSRVPSLLRAQAVLLDRLKCMVINLSFRPEFFPSFSPHPAWGKGFSVASIGPEEWLPVEVSLEVSVTLLLFWCAVFWLQFLVVL